MELNHNFDSKQLQDNVKIENQVGSMSPDYLVSFAVWIIAGANERCEAAAKEHQTAIHS